MTRPIRTDRALIATCLGALAAAAIAALTGCATGDRFEDRLANYDGARSDAWVWTQPDRYGFQPDSRRESLRVMDSHDASIAVFTGFDARVAGSDLGRRDDLMGVNDTDALPNRLAWPAEQRADLRRYRTYRSSTSAERWVFPSTRRDGHSGRAYDSHRRGD